MTDVENPSVQDVSADQIRKGSAKEGGDGNFFAIDEASKRAFQRWAGGYRDIADARSAATRIALKDPSISVENLRVGLADPTMEYAPWVSNVIWKETPYQEVLDKYNLTKVDTRRRGQ